MCLTRSRAALSGLKASSWQETCAAKSVNSSSEVKVGFLKMTWEYKGSLEAGKGAKNPYKGCSVFTVKVQIGGLSKTFSPVGVSGTPWCTRRLISVSQNQQRGDRPVGFRNRSPQWKCLHHQ